MAHRGISFRFFYRAFFFCFCVAFACSYSDGKSSKILWRKKIIVLKCNGTSMKVLARYVSGKKLHVYLADTGQYFITNHYAMVDSTLHICNKNLRPSSEEFTQEDLMISKDAIINIQYKEKYKVWKNFSILYKGKMYDYTEYRVVNDSIMICNSSNIYVRNTWKTHDNSMKMRKPYRNCSIGVRVTLRRNYPVNKRLNVFWIPSGQYLKTNNYGVSKNGLGICKETYPPLSAVFTAEDLMMCRDAIINIQNKEKHKAWENFSMLYQEKMYDYSGYRVRNDSINIRNSIDFHAQWVERQMLHENCTTQVVWLYWRYYAVDKKFNVYSASRTQYFKRNDYVVWDQRLHICKGKLGPLSTELTKEDLVMCGDAIINIQYEEKYKVWNNFSILFKKKMYDYTEYRVMNDSIKICNSIDMYVRNRWKARNDWLKRQKPYNNCSTGVRELSRWNYTVNKQLNVFWIPSGQYLKTNNYGVSDNRLIICKEKYPPVSFEFTQDDLIMCRDSIIYIQYDEKYKVWKNLSMLYKDNIYDYTEYHVVNDSIVICNSTDSFVLNCWKARNKWLKEKLADKNCTTRNRTVILGWFSELNVNHKYVNSKKSKIFSVFLSKKKESKKITFKNEYALTAGKYHRCSDNLWRVTNLRQVVIFIGALVLSSICLLSLLITYCLLPELRTLPGMNLMSLSIAFLFANISLIAFILLNANERSKNYPCAPFLVAIGFFSSSIIANATVNVYHLKKTFESNSVVKSATNNNNIKLFLKYTLFSWGFPVMLSIIDIVFVKIELASYSHDRYTGLCGKIYLSFAWYIIREYVLPGSLTLYTTIMYIFAANRIRQQLKARRKIAPKTNIIKTRRSLVPLLKSSTTAGLTWMAFLLFMNINFHPKVKMALAFVTLLSGVYIAIAFVFTRKNYRALKKKYFSGKEN